MKKPGRSLKIKEKSLWLGRALSCVVLESTRRTPLWASPIPRCSRPRSSSRAVATTSIGPVPSAVSPAPGTGSSPAPCMTWATRWGRPHDIRLTYSQHHCTRCRRFFTADPTWPRPRPATPIGSWPWPSAWWWRTAYPISSPVGTSGATAPSSPGHHPGLGGGQGGKKAADRIRTGLLIPILARSTGEFKLGGTAGPERVAGYCGPGRCAADHRIAGRGDRRVHATGESPPPDSDQQGRARELEMSSGTRDLPGTRDVAPVRRGRRIGRSRGMLSGDTKTGSPALLMTKPPS